MKQSCKFGCGFQHENVEIHEKTCWSNPERRACKTCKSWDFDEDGHYCRKELTKKATFNCEGWNN